MAQRSGLKVLGIAGSLRTGSYNKAILRIVAKSVQAQGVNVGILLNFEE